MFDPAYIDRFAALAHDLRLRVFRLLMPMGPNGLAAGDIARRLDVPPSTLSAHLTQLCQAGLLRSTRQRQSIFYAVDVNGTRDLIAFLTQDCCQGRPEICGYDASLGCSDAPGATTEIEATDER